MPPNSALKDLDAPGMAEWRDRFAYAASLLVDPPRDEHGRYIPEADKLAVVRGWLDEHALGDPPEQGHDDTWMMVAFQLAPAQWEALERTLGAPPTDSTLSRLLQRLLNRHLMQTYALAQ